MITAIWAVVSGVGGKLLGPILGSPIGAAALAIAAFMLWNWSIDNPRVRREVTRNLVARVELEAETAKRKEAERQMTAGAAALKTAQRSLDDLEQAMAAEDESREQERRDNEQKLEAAGKACAGKLDAARIEWLSRHAKKTGRRG